MIINYDYSDEALQLLAELRQRSVQPLGGGPAACRMNLLLQGDGGPSCRPRRCSFPNIWRRPLVRYWRTRTEDPAFAAEVLALPLEV